MSDPAISYDSIEIDKSSDGRYWYVLYWPDELVLLRLRIHIRVRKTGMTTSLK